MKVAGRGPSVHACAVFLRAGSRDGDKFNQTPYGVNKKVSEREESEQMELFGSLWLFTPLVKSEAHGQTVWDNVLAKRWWALGKKSVYVYVY